MSKVRENFGEIFGFTIGLGKFRKIPEFLEFLENFLKNIFREKYFLIFWKKFFEFFRIFEKFCEFFKFLLIFEEKSVFKKWP